MLTCYKTYSILLGNSFVLSIFLFLLCIGLIAMIYRWPASNDFVQITWGVLLILSSSSLAFGLTFLGGEIEKYQKLASYKCSEYLLLISISIEYSKNIISFGIAAIGAGITANVLTERFSIKKHSSVERRQSINSLLQNNRELIEREILVEKSELHFKKSLNTKGHE